MFSGNLKAVGLAISIAVGSLALTACGSEEPGTTTEKPPLSAATADRLIKLSERVATDLDAGATCDAAHAADDLSAAVEESDLPASLQPGVDEVAGRLVDEVNCPPPPPPPEPKEDKKKDEEQRGDEGGDEESSGPGNGGVPPGQAKLKGAVE